MSVSIEHLNKGLTLHGQQDNTPYLYAFNSYTEAFFIYEEIDDYFVTPNNDEIRRAFGKALKILRVEQDMSQEELAGRVGMERTFISLVERGLQEPRLTTIKRFADGFDLTLTELFMHVEKLMKN